MKTYSLYQLNSAIRITLNQHVPASLWVSAEIHGISTNYSGHCYLDLIEKSPTDDRIIAKQRATIWSSAYRSLSAKFEKTTGQTLKEGLKILVEVSVVFHELYGMSLNVTDIDPTYTLGDLQRRRQEIIERLKKRGLIDKNKQLSLPILPQKIAVVSSPTAAGYNDFIHQLVNNQYGFYYTTTLFSAIMQGNQAEESILNALFEIESRKDEFDLVVIIRGGGATSDLQAFDSETLAERCALFPLPILSGIGHLRDESVLDLVAYASLKTPTAAAEYIVSLTLKVALLLDELSEKIKDSALRQIEREKNKLMLLLQYIPQQTLKLLSQSQLEISRISHKIELSANDLISKNKNKLVELTHRIKLESSALIAENRTKLDQQQLMIKSLSRRRFDEHASKMALLATKLSLLDPKNILSKGYSFTVKDGKIVTKASDLKEGDVLTTTFAHGKADSIVTKK